MDAYTTHFFLFPLWNTSIAIFSGALEIKLIPGLVRFSFLTWQNPSVWDALTGPNTANDLSVNSYTEWCCACIVCIAFLKSSLFLASPLYADIFSSDKDKILRGSWAEFTRSVCLQVNLCRQIIGYVHSMIILAGLQQTGELTTHLLKTTVIICNCPYGVQSITQHDSICSSCFGSLC